MVYKNITSALYESQIYTINMLVSYLQEQNVNNDFIYKSIDAFKKSLTQISVDDIYPVVPIINTPKAKKLPSAYNMFIRDKIHEFKKQYPQSNGHDLMRLATAAWKTTNNNKNNVVI